MHKELCRVLQCVKVPSLFRNRDVYDLISFQFYVSFRPEIMIQHWIFCIYCN